MSKLTSATVVLVVSIAFSLHGQENSRWSSVAPDTISITVRTQRVEPGGQRPYRADPADEVKFPSGRHRVVYRNGKAIGTLVGRDRNILWTFDRVIGEPPDTSLLDNPENYTVRSPDDRNYARPVHPLKVHRKTRPYGEAVVDWPGKWRTFTPLTENVLFLKLAKPLTPGKRYVVGTRINALQQQAFTYNPKKFRSEAVHVTHIGFRPDDPVKVAFLSCWTGTGGGLQYSASTKFGVLEQRTGREVFQGTIQIRRRAGESEDARGTNFNKADVYMMDFSRLTTPGTYRVYVQGVGCSFPFEIARDVWLKAFRVTTRGLYHMRSGIELKPPYATYKRPRPFHPDDGVEVHAATVALMDTHMGIGKRSAFSALMETRTDQVLPQAWGGLMDAADYDRRIQHLRISVVLLDLVELFPDTFASLDLNIPESRNRLPDVVDEALFNLDCYRRMQTRDGGIRGGIESSEHPRWGECSWQDSLPVMAFGPGPWSSYLYAGTAAQAARWLQSRKPILARTYRNSALRAMEWAEKEMVRRKQANEPTDYGRQVEDARNTAAAQLFRLTGDRRWHDLFVATTPFRDAPGDAGSLWRWAKTDQRDAVWVYLRTDRRGIDPRIRENCLATLVTDADDFLESINRTGFRWGKKGYDWAQHGVMSSQVKVGEILVRAHVLTGDDKYLQGLILACQLGLGANPLNFCYTTGLGHRYPKYNCHHDSRFSDLPLPPGITVFGPADPSLFKNHWALNLINRYCHPDAYEWPAIEAYWDLGTWWAKLTEWTPQQTNLANIYAWGYLDARE